MGFCCLAQADFEFKVFQFLPPSAVKRVRKAQAQGIIRFVVVKQQI